MNIELKTHILKRGISQLRVARDAEVSDSYLSKVLNEWVDPPKEVKDRLASVLGCPVSEIFQEEKEDHV